MATVREAITDELKEATVEITAISMDRLLVRYALNGDATYTPALDRQVGLAVLSKLSGLLVTPSITEGGMSIKYDPESVRLFIAQRAAALGVPNPLADQPKIRMSGRRW